MALDTPSVFAEMARRSVVPVGTWKPLDVYLDEKIMAGRACVPFHVSRAKSRGLIHPAPPTRNHLLRREIL